MRLFSWNVNGIRAVLKKDFLRILTDFDADIVCLQETKARPEQVAEVEWPDDFSRHWNSAEKPGYSGTVVFSKRAPLSVTTGIGHAEHDREGRVLTLEFEEFHLINVYVPNSKRGLARLPYRTTAWEPAFREYVVRLDRTKPVVICGDLNVAHREIDIARPKDNVKNAGFTPEERACLTELLDAGFVDTFRALHPGTADAYTWWSYMNQARTRNIGWRIDYFLTSERLLELSCAPPRSIPRSREATIARWVCNSGFRKSTGFSPVTVELLPGAAYFRVPKFRNPP